MWVRGVRPFFRRFSSTGRLSGLDAFVARQNLNHLKFVTTTSSLRQELLEEAVHLLVPEGMTPPELNKGFFYFQRYDECMRFCRVPADTHGKTMDIESSASPLEEEILSLGDLERDFGGTNPSVSAAKISLDNRVLGFVADRAGDERWTLRFRDIAGKKFFPLALPLVRNFEWIDNPLNPGRFLYYTEMDPDTLRSVRVVRAELSSDLSSVLRADCVWELSAEDSVSYLDLFKSKDGQCIFLSSSSKTRSEVRVVRADEAVGVPAVVHPPQSGVQYYCEHREGFVYKVSNEEFVNFALYRRSLNEDGEIKKFHLLHHSPDMTIADLDMFRKAVVLYGHGFEGQPAVEVVRFREHCDVDTLSDSSMEEIDLVKIPFKGSYSVGKLEVGVNGDFEADKCRFTFRSPSNPGTCLELGLRDRSMEALRSREFQRKAEVGMRVERFGVNSADGQAVIPLTLVTPEDFVWDHSSAAVPNWANLWSTDVKQNAPVRCLVHVYGAYGTVLEPDFSPAITALVRRGWAVAFAHVRGGGERGPDWHRAATGTNRMRSVADFKSCCDWLVDQGITTVRFTAALGASAGGVVLGAALNQWGTSLIGAGAIMRMPFVDLVDTLANPALPLSLHEVEEWGDVTIDSSFLKSISPIDNVTPQAYPPMYITCAEDDARVPFEGVLKYAQKLATVTEPNQLVLKITGSGEGGHFGSANYDDTCEELAFLLKHADANR